MEPANKACIRGVTIQEKRITIYCDIFSLYCDILRYVVFIIFSKNPINYSIFAFTLNLRYKNKNYTHTHICLKTFNKGIMSQACFCWTYYCYKIGYERKRKSLNRRKKSCDILRYTFRIVIRYNFLCFL